MVAQIRPVSRTVIALTMGCLTGFSTVYAAAEQDLGQVLVTAESETSPALPETSSLGTQSNRVSREQIENQAATDINHALTLIPGVMTRSQTMMGGQTSHGIYVRGRGASHPGSDVAIYFDGVPRAGAIYGQTLFDGISLGSVEAIEVFKSPQPANFGSGYAAVNMEPRKIKRAGQEVEISVAGGSHETVNEEVFAGYKNDRFDVSAVQNWASTAGHVNHSRAQQQNYYLNTGWQLTPNEEVRFLANRTLGQTLQPDKRGGARSVDRYDTDTTFFTLTLNSRRESSEGFLKTYYNDTQYDLLGERKKISGTVTKLADSRQSMKLYGVRGKYSWSFAEATRLTVGMDLDRTETTNRQRMQESGATTYWDFPTMTLFSPYASVSYDWQVGDVVVTPSVGLRSYTHSEFKDVVAPQAGLVVSSGLWRWNANYARGVNYPTPVALQGLVVRGRSHSSQAWASLKPEVVDHYETGIGLMADTDNAVNLTVFYDRGRDRFRVNMSPNVPPTWNDPVGRYKVAGLEASIQKSFGPDVKTFAAVTYMNVRATDSAGKLSKHLAYSPKWLIQGGATWNITHAWKLYADAMYVSDLWSGMNARPSQNFGYSTDKKLKDFLLVNVKLSRTFEPPQGLPKNAEVFVSVNNLLNRDYAWDAGYPMPGITAFAGVKFGF